MVSISNDLLHVEVSLKGAELQSIYNKQIDLEYLWSGDTRFWGKKSPVLFPIVGGLKSNTYTYRGRQYSLGRHGFARDIDFYVNQTASSSVTLSLKDSEQTSSNYPFRFIFSVEYVLVNNTLTVGYIVENTGDTELLFSVGGHPAFKVPLVEGTAYEDYYLLFDKPENAPRFPLSKEGLIETTSVPFLHNSNRLDLKKELFYKDALVFKYLRSNSMSLLSQATTHGLTVFFEGFPFLGIWAARDADFVCIEPWAGIADGVDASGELENKEGIQRLNPGGVFRKSFKVEIF